MTPSYAYFVSDPVKAHEVAFVQLFCCFMYLSGARHVSGIRLLRAAVILFSFLDHDVDYGYVRATFEYTHFIVAQLKLSAWSSRT